jgi:hypothetical protein
VPIEGERGKGAVRAGMGIATNNRRRWQGRPLFRLYDMNNPLPPVVHREMRNLESVDVFVQRFNLQARNRSPSVPALQWSAHCDRQWLKST